MITRTRPRSLLALLALLASVACARSSAARVTLDHEPAHEPAPAPAHEQAMLSTFVRATVREYCESFPSRCDRPEPCPPIVIDETGATTGGCYPAEYVCCGPLGCVAVLLAGDCLGGSDLYWSDCEAGESAIDPVTDLAVVICHD
jgi:hypothetical protein